MVNQFPSLFALVGASASNVASVRTHNAEWRRKDNAIYREKKGKVIGFHRNTFEDLSSFSSLNVLGEKKFDEKKGERTRMGRVGFQCCTAATRKENAFWLFKYC